MTGRWLTGFLAIVMAAAALPADACSFDAEYVRPSNFELVQSADSIAIATPERETGKAPDQGLALRVEKAVKGTPPDRVDLPFATLYSDDPGPLARPSESGLGRFTGPCGDSAFARGGRYLLFLERDADGGWRRLASTPAGLDPGDGGGEGERIRAVRRYDRLQRTLGPMEQIAALRAMIGSGRDPDGALLSMAARADMIDHLSSVSQWKPTAWLLDAHRRLERGEPLPFGDRSDWLKGGGDPAATVTAFLLDQRLPRDSEERQAERMTVLLALAEGDHPGAMPLFERLFLATDIGARERGLVLRYLARNGQYARAYQWIESRLLGEVVRRTSKEARALIRDVAKVQRGESYDEGRERWRADPHAAATWPELALALVSYQLRTFGEDRTEGFEDAIRSIPVADFRARPELTVARGGSDDEVRAWARAELARPARPPPPPRSEDEYGPVSEDPDLLPLRILVSTGFPEDRTVLMGAFCQGGERRRLVVLALGQWGDGLNQGLLESMAAVPGLSDGDRSHLLRAAIEMAARDITDAWETTFLTDDEESWLVTRLARRTAPAAPVACPAPG